MPRRIAEDHQSFRDVIKGNVRKELKRLLATGTVFSPRVAERLAMCRFQSNHKLHTEPHNWAKEGFCIKWIEK